MNAAVFNDASLLYPEEVGFPVTCPDIAA